MDRTQKISCIKRLLKGEKPESIPFDGILFEWEDENGITYYSGSRMGIWFDLTRKQLDNVMTKTGLTAVILPDRDPDPDEKVLSKVDSDE